MTTEARFFQSDLVLESGHTLRGARLAYATYGTLSPARDNVILFPTRFGATHVMNEPMIGPGHALDTDCWFVIVPSLLGNGLSSSPSNSPAPYQRSRFPLVTIRDNVAFQHRLLTQELGIERIALAVGWSMGGQQVYQWAVSHPQMVERLAVICGTARTSPHNRVFLESLRAAVEADAAFAGGWYDKPPRLGLRAMGRIYAGWAYSQDWYRARTWEVLGYSSLDDWLMAYWDALFEAREANDLLSMVATWIANDVSAPFGGDLSRALARITAPTLLLPCATDLYFRTRDNEIEAESLPDARVVEIPSIWGHMCVSGQWPADIAFVDRELKLLLEA